MTLQTTHATIYENCIPDFVAPALERLYKNVFSSIPFLRLYCPAINRLHTYVAASDGKPRTILLFEIANGRARVHNEGIQLNAQETERFAHHLFRRYPSLGAISFNAVRTAFRDLQFPLQRFNCSEDIVVALPDGIVEYEALLSKSTRKNIRRYMSKLKRECPSMRHEVFEGAAASDRQVREIIALNHARMAAKGKTSSYDDAETERLIRLVRRSGMLSIVSIDGRICAGEICSRVGDHYFAHVGGHDPAYDLYRLGTLSCYLAITECIRRRGSEFHFLWGRYDYKFMLAGTQRDLERLVIYRSRAHVCLHGGMATQLALNAYLRKLKNSASAVAASSETSAAQRVLRFASSMRTNRPPMR